MDSPNIPAILAEIDRITPLLATVGHASANGDALSAEDVRLAIDVLKKLRAKLEALAAG